MPMRAERDKLNAKTLALQLRMTESEYRLQEDDCLLYTSDAADD